MKNTTKSVKRGVFLALICMMAFCLAVPVRTEAADGKINITIAKGNKKAVFATVKGSKLTFGKISKFSKIMGKGKKDGKSNEYSISKKAYYVTYKSGKSGKFKDITQISIGGKGYSIAGIKVGDKRSAAEKKLKKLFGKNIEGLDEDGFSIRLAGSDTNGMGYYLAGWYEKGKVANVSFFKTSE